MQLYALNQVKQLIFADHAVKQIDYICIECQGVVRARGGMHRQNHYYHLKPNLSCHLSSKSMIHIQTQAYFKKNLPEHECVLERRFPEINRIADVVWLPQKLIFEIQCSPISAQEVQNRNLDYARLGFQVVWILHDNRFNQSRLSAAESFLRKSPVYFTNIDANGKGMVYDQFDHFEKGHRSHQLPALAIALEAPRRVVNKVEKSALAALPLVVQQRLDVWPVYFSGDLIDLCLFEIAPPEYIQKVLELEQVLKPKQAESTFWERVKQIVRQFAMRPYRLIFQMLLEKACK